MRSIQVRVRDARVKKKNTAESAYQLIQATHNDAHHD